jgi:hypothetical protein
MKARSSPFVLAILAVAALSTFAIACRTTSGFGTPSSVELRQVQQVATAFNSAIDVAIARRSSGVSDNYVDICGPRFTRIFRDMFDHVVVNVPQGPRTTMDDLPVLLTVRELQEVRSLFNVKRDEAFASRDSAAYRELLSLKVDHNGITGTVRAPRQTVTIGGVQ